MLPPLACTSRARHHFALLRLPLDVLLVVSHHMSEHPLALPPGAHSRATLALFSRPLDIAIRAVSAFGWSASLVAVLHARIPRHLSLQALRYLLTRAGDLASRVPALESETGSLWWWHALRNATRAEFCDVLLKVSPRKYVEENIHAILLRACEVGVSLEAMEATLDKGSKHLHPMVVSDQKKPSAQYSDSELYTAAKGGHVAIAHLLLNYRIGMGPRSALLYPPPAVHEVLLHSALTNNVTAMKTLLGAGVDPNNATEDGKTSLMESALHERVDVMEVLLAHGADVNRQDAFGKTALMYAVGRRAPYQYGKRITSFVGAHLWNAHVVHTLLCAGADPALCDAVGQTALMLACRYRDVHTLDRLLAEATPQVLNAQDAKGSTALMFVFRRGPIVVEHLERLLSSGADPDIPDTSGTTPLLLAASRTSFAAISTLLYYGADPCTRDPVGRTALHHFVTARHARYCRSHTVLPILMLAGGPCAIEATDAQGRTALMTAFDFKCERCVSELISVGADVFVGCEDVATEGNQAARERSLQL